MKSKVLEMARRLDGNEYPFKLADVLRDEARDDGLVIVYGQSDDGMGFDGAIHDEVGCYNGGTAYLHDGVLLKNACESDDCPYHQTRLRIAKTIEAIWCGPEGFSWSYKTKIPHATFNIMEDGEIYSQGIVFDIADIS